MRIFIGIEYNAVLYDASFLYFILNFDVLQSFSEISESGYDTTPPPALRPCHLVDWSQKNTR